MTIHRKVVRAIDGDTLEVRNKIRGTNFIRLAGVYAPERGQRGYAPAKRKLLRLKGKVVTLVPKGKSYGGTVADVRYRRKKLRR